MNTVLKLYPHMKRGEWRKMDKLIEIAMNTTDVNDAVNILYKLNHENKADIERFLNNMAYAKETFGHDTIKAFNLVSRGSLSLFKKLSKEEKEVVAKKLFDILDEEKAISNFYKDL